MNSFLVSSPISKIFKLGQKCDFDKVTSNCSFYVTFKSNPFPKLNNSIIRSIKEKCNNIQELKVELYNVNFSFPIMTKTIIDITKEIKSMNVNNQYYSSVYILYSFVSWLINFVKTGRTYPGEIILTALTTISDEKLRKIAMSAFYLGMMFVFDSKNVTMTEKISAPLEMFFSNPNDYPTKATHLFVLVLKNSSSFEKNEITQIVKLITKIAKNYPNLFDESTVNELIHILKDDILSFSEVPFLCFSQLLELQNINIECDDIFIKLQGKILDYLSKLSDMHKFPINELNEIIKLPNLINNDYFGFLETETFDDKLDLTPLIDIDDSISLLDFSLLTTFFVSISSSRFMKQFYDTIIHDFEEKSEYSIEYVLFFVHLSLHLGELKIFKIIFDKIQIFNPNINVFNSTLTKELNPLRNSFLILLSNFQDLIPLFFQNILQYPLILTEVFYRLTKLNINIDMSILSDIINYYKNCDIVLTEYKKEITNTRKSILYYIKVIKIFQLFNDHNFINTIFLNMLFEVNLQNYVCQLINEFLIYNKEANEIFNSLSYFLRKLLSTNQNEQINNLLSIMVQLLIDIFTKTQYAEFNSYILDDLLFCFSKLTPTQELFNLSIKCFNICSKYWSIKENNLKLIKCLIHKIYGEELPATLFNTLLDLVSNDNIHIYNPYIIQLIIEYFPQKTEEVFLFLNNLLDNENNCRILHEIHFDLYLIESMNNYKNNKIIDYKSILSLCSLFKKIAFVISSISVVAKYIALLSPRSDGKLSIYEPIFSIVILGLIEDYYIKSSKHFIIENFKPCEKTFKTRKELYISFWYKIIRFDETNEISIFEANNDLSSIKISIKGETIYFSFDNNGNSQVITNTVILNKWNFVILKINEKNILVNFDLCLIKSLDPQLSFLNNTFNGIIGDKVHKNTSLKSQIGFFGIYDQLPINKQTEIFENGPFYDYNRNNDSLFTYQVFHNEKITENFSHILIHFWNFSIMLPIFSTINIPFTDGSHWDEGLSISMDIFQKALVLSQSIQTNFVETKKIFAISYLLTKMEQKFISYDLYFSFFSIFQSLRNEQLKIQIMDSILFNNEIWERSTPEDYLKILQHWESSLTFYSIFQKLYPFSIVLIKMNMYFKYSKTKENYQEYRKVMHSLLLSAANVLFSKTDFNEIINQTIYTDDHQQSEDLLLFMKFFIVHSHDKLISANIQYQDVLRLTHLFKSKRELIALSIYTQMDFYRQGILSIDNLNAHVFILLEKIKELELITPPLFQSLIELNIEFPDLFLINCWIASNTENKLIKEQFDYFIDKQLFKKDSILSPLLLINSLQFVKSKNFFKHLIGILLNSFQVDLDYLFFSVYFFSQNTEELQKYILECILETISTYDSIFTKRYIKLAIFYLLMRSENYKGKSIDFMSSPFHENAVEKHDFWYGVRLDENYNWIDLDFAKAILELIPQNKNVKTVSPLLKLISHFDIEYAKTMYSHLQQKLKEHQIDFEELYLKLKKRRKTFQNIKKQLNEKFTNINKGIEEYKQTIYVYDQSTSLYSIIHSSIHDQKKENKRIWSRLWSALTVESPWDTLCSNFPRKWKRAGDICSYFCPNKFKKIFTLCGNHKINEEENIVPYKNAFECNVIKFNKIKKAQYLMVKYGVCLQFPNKQIQIQNNNIRLIVPKKSFIEIYTKTHSSHLIQFKEEDLSTIIDVLLKANSEIIVFEHENDLTNNKIKKWNERKISNFQFLMFLNICNGRSFKDFKYYPILPSIIEFLDGDYLNLDDNDIYRDFTIQKNKPQILNFLVRINHHITSNNIIPTFTSLKDINEFELTPEFYNQPEIFYDINNKNIPNVILPKWAKNPIDFVYLHRKALESKYVSENLHKWINNVFKTDIPQKIQDGTKYSLDSIIELSFLTPICYFALFINDYIYVLDAIGCLQKYHFDFQQKNITLIQNESFGEHNLQTYLCSELQNPVQFIRNKKFSIMFANNKYPYYFLINCKTMKIEKNSLMDGQLINEISASKSYRIITSPSDKLNSTIYKGNRFHASVTNYRDVIKCICISSTFQISVIGTENGGLLVSSVNSGRIINVIELGNAEPLNIMITRSFGFIVVATKEMNEGIPSYYISVYTNNGLFIRKKQVNGIIKYWVNWKSPKGFDYIAYVTEKTHNNIVGYSLFECEAYYLNIKEINYDVKSQIVSMNYIHSYDSIFIAQKDSTFAIIPNVIDDLYIEQNRDINK